MFSIFLELRKNLGYSFDVKNIFFRCMRFSGPSRAHKCVFQPRNDFVHDLKICISSIYTVCIRVFKPLLGVSTTQGFLKFPFFLPSSKKYFLSELRNFLGYSYDVKSSNLSIYEVFRTIGARQIRFSELHLLFPGFVLRPWDMESHLVKRSDIFCTTSKSKKVTTF